MKKISLFAFVLAVFFVVTPLFAQSGDNATVNEPRYYNPVITGGHLFTITPDARAAGMAGIGLTTSADAYSQFHNISKLPWSQNKWGVSLSYTPWMAEVAKDISLSTLTGYYTWGGENGLKHAISSTFRYFHIGKGVAFFNHLFEPIAIQPYELAFDVAYGLKFHRHWSVGVGLKYLRSDYNYSSGDVKGVVNSVLFDLSSTYQTSVSLGAERTGLLRVALAINNIGGKMSFDGGRSYLYSPAIFRIGVGLESEVEPMHQVGAHLEISKMLAPTYPMVGEANYESHMKQYMNQSGFAALFSSWGDAPGGFAEELKEVMWSLGGEYAYDNRFFVRAGYQYQHKSKGTGAGFALGAGLIYEKVKFDMSYFLATQPKSPLNNTLRFTLGVDF